MATQKIETGLIADSAVTTAKLADNSVTAAKIAAGSLDDQVKGISSSADAVAITIDSSENVGIGELDPQEKLQINGNLRMFSAGYPLIDIGITTSNYFRFLYDNPNDIFKIGKNGATTLNIGGSGNVGIGDISPENRLHVKGAANTSTTVQIESASNQYAPKILFDGLVGASADYLLGQIIASWDAHTNEVAAIRFESGSDTTNKDDGLISFWTSDAGSTLDERMRIDTSGKVAIGDTSAGTYQLKVDSGSNGTSNAEAGIFVEGQRSGVVFNLVSNNTANAANRGSGIKFQSGGFTTGAIIMRSDAIAASTDAPGYMTFHTSTDGSEDLSERMRIDSSGNVGINETSPDYKLHISGIGSSAQMQIESTSNSNAQLIFRNTASAGSGITGGFHIGLLGDTSGDGLIYHHHDKPIRFYTNAANTMTLTGENGMLHLNGRSGAHGYAVPQDESLGYTNNLNAGGFGILHRGSYDSYVTGNAYYYKTGGSAGWRAKYGAYKSTVMGMVNGAFTFDCSTTAPGTNGASVSGLAARVRIDSDGLKFGSDTGAANALDDYEEGTFTPTCTNLGTTVYSAKYTKVGDLVTLVVYLETTTANSGTSGPATFTGLPFTSQSNGWSTGALSIAASNPVNGAPLHVRVVANSSQIDLKKNNDTTMTGSDVDAGHIIWTVSYKAA